MKGGVPSERHLCERCARELGVHPRPPASPLKVILSEIIASAQGPQAQSAGSPEAQATNCRQCGMPYSQFRTSGLLGCSECYRTFEGLLAPLLARAHEGGTHHVGRKPAHLAETTVPPAAATKVELDARAEAETERRSRAAVLRRKLAEAVASEQYEVAAKLRDELLHASADDAARATPARDDDSPGTADGGER
jgi:protein arginine kinase activator